MLLMVMFVVGWFDDYKSLSDETWLPEIENKKKPTKVADGRFVELRLACFWFHE